MPTSQPVRPRNQKPRMALTQSAPPLAVELLEDRSVPSVTGYRPVNEVGNNVAAPPLGTAS